MLLVRTPRPYPTESFGGYLLRVTEANGYHSIAVILNIAEIRNNWKPGWYLDLTRLEKILNLPSASLAPWANTLEKTRKGKAQLSGQEVNRNYLVDTTIRFCPQCVVESGFIETHWDLVQAVACARHRCMATFTCWQCGEALRLFRPKLLECHCGADLRKSPISSVPDAVLELQAILRGTVLKLASPEISACGMPAADLSAMSLRSLTTTISCFGGCSISSTNWGGEQSDLALVTHVADAFSNWPGGFRQMLRGMADRAGVKDGERSLRTFRRFYLILFNTLFRRKLPLEEVEFMYEALTKFGRDEWGGRGGKPPSCGNASARRFQSVGEAATDLGVTLREAQRLAREGTIFISATEGKGKPGTDSNLVPARVRFKTEVGRTIGTRKAAASLGIPVTVLIGLRAAGHFQVAHVARPKKAFHELDLKAFGARFPKPPLVSTCPGSVRFNRALRTTKFSGEEGKLKLVVAVLEGRLVPIGRSGEEIGDLLFDLGEIKSLHSEIRRGEWEGFLTGREAGRVLGCEDGVIHSLVKQEFLAGTYSSSSMRVREESVTSFMAEFESTTDIARRERTSPRLIPKAYRDAGIPLVVATNTVGRPLRYFVHRADVQKLSFPLASKKAQLAARKVIPSDPMHLLLAYFERLRRDLEPLPRRRWTPNKREIAKACGLGRHVFYDPVAAALLRTYDLEDRERCSIEKLDNIGVLCRYLNGLSESRIPLPRWVNGRPNKRAIAAACGFHRNAIYNNPTAAAILDDFVDAA